MPWYGILGVVASVLGVTGWAANMVRKARKAGSTLLGHLFEKHLGPVIDSRVQPVKEQLTPNGGKSVYDQVARIDQWREDTTDRLTTIEKHLTEQDRTMSRHLRDHSFHA